MRQLLGHKFIAVIAVLYTIALTLGSLIRPVHLIDDPVTYLDKLLHAGAYFGLTLLWILWKYIKNKNEAKIVTQKTILTMFIVIAVCAIIYGIIIELLQGTITNYRTPDGWDVLANTTGSVLALLTCLLYINKSKMLKSKF
ncbi:VanZ family protein [Dokdonia sp.]|uniref:VanZ family protein n=1 Tax=Dokdonia sp. TaxID=2024995 RepID=UPI003264DC52